MQIHRCTSITFILICGLVVSNLLVRTAAATTPAAAPTTVQPCASSIAVGDTMTCSISAAAESDTISFNGTQGDSMLVRVGTTAGTLNPRIRLAGPDGTMLCQAGSSYALGAEITQCLLTQTGTQTITVTDYNGTRVGSYSLYIQRLTNPVGAAPLAMNSIATASLTTAALAHSFTFAASRNESVIVRASSTAGDVMPLIRVFGSDGSVLCSAGNAYSAGIEISRCVLPFDGMYTILVADYKGTQTGTVNLYVQRLNAPVGAAAVAAGMTAAATIQTAAEADTYSMTANGSASVFIRVATTAGTMMPLVRVVDADGVALCTAGTAYSAGAEISRCLLPQTGTYTVLVSDYRGTATGSYNLYMQQLTAPAGAVALTPGETVAGVLQAAATMQTYRVDERADDVLLLRAGRSAGTMMPFLAVYDPDGVRLCTGGSPYYAGAEISRCALPRATAPIPYLLATMQQHRPAIISYTASA